MARRSGGRDQRRPDPAGGTHGTQTRWFRESAAGFGALRRSVFHARHDGHHPQPRCLRRVRGGHRRGIRKRTFRVGLLPPFHSDVRRGGRGRPGLRLRGRADRTEAQARRRARHRPGTCGPEGAGGHLQGDQQRAPGWRVDLRPGRTAPPGRERGVPFLAEPPRRGVPPRQQHSLRPRHRRQRHADGLRQPR